MPKGYAIVLGLNHVDPSHYDGWDGALAQPENDAVAIHKIASDNGLISKIFLGNDVTRDNVITSIRAASRKLTGGDFLFVYYSGHGGQLPDMDGDEEDGLDETWCLFDGELIDDELHLLWSEFKKDVRILVISDSCHSGTVTKAPVGESEPEGCVKKEMPMEYVRKTYLKNKSFYDNLALELMEAGANEKEVQAGVLLISGCRDEQSSYAFIFDENSAFTTALLKVLRTKPSIDYLSLHKEITDELIVRLKGKQTPNLYETGQLEPAFPEQDFLTI
jgi:hypothetical protein